ncbi:MAG: hypothetical protein ACLFPL_05225 [Candidatus Nanoarchaeia archaeon]
MFVWHFIWNLLDRKYFYKKLLIKARNDNEIVASSCHKIDLPENLNDFVDNFFYIKDNQQELIMETEFLFKFIQIYLDLDLGYNYLDSLFFSNDKVGLIFKFENLNQKISSHDYYRRLVTEFFYDLRIKYRENLEKILQIESYFDRTLTIFLESSNSYSFTISSFSLNSQEIMTLIDHENSFVLENEDKNKVLLFSRLLNQKINQIKENCMLILSLDIEERYKKKYLENNMSSLYQLFNPFTYFNSEFNSFHGDNNAFLNLKNKKNKTESDKKILEIVELKQKIIDKAKQNLEFAKLELMYKILLQIDEQELSNMFFETSLKIKNSPIERNLYYKNIDFDFDRRFLFDKLDFTHFSSAFGGINSINYIKYKLIFECDNFIKGLDLEFEKYSKEEFMEPNDKKIGNNIKELNFGTVQRFLPSLTKSKFSSFKKKAKSEVKRLIEKYKQDETNYICEARIDESSKTKETQEKVKNGIEDFNLFLASIFELRKKSNKSINDKSLFGINKLEKKDWFLEKTYNQNISLGTVMVGENLTKDYIQGKFDYIHNSLIKQLNSNEEEFIVQNLYTDLKNTLIKRGKEYILFLNRDFNTYDFPLLERHNKFRFYLGEIEINSSKVHIFDKYHLEKSLLIEKSEFEIIQYNNVIENNDGLFVKITNLEENEIQDIINSGSNTLNTREEVETHVKIRILEKFEVKRRNKSKIITLVK